MESFAVYAAEKQRVQGLLLAVASAVWNGTFSVPAKLERVKRARVSPVVFNFWASVGIVISCVISLLFVRPFVWAAWGLLSGVLFVIATANAFLAVEKLGVSIATGLWCGVSVIVSFLVGQIVDPSVENWFLAMTAVIVLLLGIGGVALAGHQGRVETGGEAEDTAEQLLPSSDEASSAAKQNFVVGTLAATITGTLGGLILIPMKFEESYKQGLPYLPSFGLGVLLGAPIVTAIPFAVKGCAPPILPSDRTVPLLGIFSGILWNAANACSIMAIQSIGYSLAYPIMQCGLFVAGLWGILLFGDIRGRTPLAGYWLSGATLIVGATLLSLA